MKRAELEHVIRAAGAIVGARELVILGSQSVLGLHPDPPAELLVSQEVDTYPLSHPERADLIDGSIGELSPFHETFGYYAHGVGEQTAVLPSGWRTRWVRVENENTAGVAGLCLHPADLAVSKLAAGRPKDMSYVAALFRHGLIRPAEVRAVLPELDSRWTDLVASRLDAVLGSGAIASED